MAAKTKLFTVNIAHNVTGMDNVKVLGAAPYPDNQVLLTEAAAKKLVKIGAIDLEVKAFEDEEEVNALKAELAQLRSNGQVEGDNRPDTGEEPEIPAVDAEGGEPSGGDEPRKIPKAQGSANNALRRKRDI
jgi:hypothetical protein